jgi:hypothetical protein
MQCDDSNQNQDHDPARCLLGLSADETDEFIVLDELASRIFRGRASKDWSRKKEQRWLELFNKKHAEVMRPFVIDRRR